MSDFRVCACGHLDFMHLKRQDCTATVPVNTTGDVRRCECETFQGGK